MKNEKKKIMLFAPILLVFTLFLISLAIAPTIRTVNPNGVGPYTQFTYVVPAIPHWDAVSESVENTSDYVLTRTANHVDLFEMDNVSIPLDATINNLTVYMRAQRANSSNSFRNISLMIQSSGVNSTSPYFTLTSAYATYSNTWTTDPATGQAWNASAINLTKIGMKSGATLPGGQVDWVYAIVSYTPNPERIEQGYKITTLANGQFNLSGLYDNQCIIINNTHKKCEWILGIDNSLGNFVVPKSALIGAFDVPTYNLIISNTTAYTYKNKTYGYETNISCVNDSGCNDNNATTIDICGFSIDNRTNGKCMYKYELMDFFSRQFQNFTETPNNLLIPNGTSAIKLDFLTDAYVGGHFNFSVGSYTIDPLIGVCGILNSTGELYILIQNVSSTGTCFNVTANDVTIDCNGYWINYSTGSTGTSYGVATNSSNTKVQNCNIVQASANAESYPFAVFNGVTLTSQNNVYNLSKNASLGTQFPTNNGLYRGMNMTGNIALYYFNESSGTVVDYSGRGNNQVNNGTAGMTYGVSGVLNTTGLRFNKTAFMLNSSPSGLPTGAGARSISVWFYLNSYPEGGLDYPNFVAWGTGSYGQLSALGIYASDNPACLTKGPSYNCIGFFGYSLDLPSSVTPALNTWYHVVGTYDGNTVRLYINGAADTSDPYTWDTQLSAKGLTLGKSSADGDWGILNGTIDEVAVWNRTLSAAEIAHMYEFQKFNHYTTDTFTVTGGAGDTTAPVITLNEPATTTNITLSYQQFNCTGSDNINLTNLSIYGNFTGSWAINITNSSPINNTKTSFNVTGIADGYYVWNCFGMDNSSNSAFATSNWTIRRDSTAPTITLPVYTNATKKRNTDTLTLNVSVIDAGIGASYCSINANGTNVTIAVSNGWCNSTTIALTGLANGNQTIYAYANDTVGNTALNNSYVVWIDTTAPVVTLPVYTNLTKYANTQSMIFNISVIDAGVGASYCSINVNGNTNQTLAVSSGWCNGTYALTGLTNGNYTINAYANDTLGNTALNNSYMVWIDNPVAIACVGATYNFTCGQNVNESCTLNGDVSATATCFSINTANVVLDCNGYTINYSSSTNGSGISTNSANTTIKNCVIKETTATSSTFSYGINFSNTVNGTAFNNNITTLGIRSHAIKLDLSNNTLLYSNILLPKGNLSHSIDLNYSYNNLMRNNNLTSISDYYCTALTYYQSVNNTFTNNSVFSACYDGAGLDDVNSNNNTFSYNVVNTTTYNTHAMYLSGCTNEIVFNNSFYTSGESDNAIHLLNSDSNNVSNNNGLATGSGAGLVIIGSDSNIFNNNNLSSGQDGVGVYFDTGSSNNNLTNNYIFITASSAQGVLFTGTATTNNLIKDTYINSTQSNDIWSNTNGINNFTNCTFDKTDSSIAGSAVINVFWYADTYVNSSVGSPLENVNVSIYDVKVVLINTQLTNASGYIPLRQTLREYMQNATAMYFDTNYSFNGTLTGYNSNYTIVNLTGNRLAGTNPVVITLTQITDTCTYGGSGNWVINCADNCAFSTIQTIPLANVTVYGTGTLTFNSGGYWNFGGTNQYISIFSGCTLVINSGGGII